MTIVWGACGILFDRRVHQTHNNRVSNQLLPSHLRSIPGHAEIQTVLINRESLPRNLAWIAVFAGRDGRGHCRLWGLWHRPTALAGRQQPYRDSMLGILGSLIMLFEFCCGRRKKVRAWRIGSARAWMRAHIWLGLLTVPLIVLHSGFSLGGQLSTLLMILFGIVDRQRHLRSVSAAVPAADDVRAGPGRDDLFADRLRCRAVVLERRGLDRIHLRQRPAKNRRCGPRPQKAESAPAFVTVGAVRTVGSVQGKVLQTQVPAAASINTDVLRDSFRKTVGPVSARRPQVRLAVAIANRGGRLLSRTSRSSGLGPRSGRRRRRPWNASASSGGNTICRSASTAGCTAGCACTFPCRWPWWA